MHTRAHKYLMHSWTHSRRRWLVLELEAMAQATYRPHDYGKSHRKSSKLTVTNEGYYCIRYMYVLWCVDRSSPPLQRPR